MNQEIVGKNKTHSQILSSYHKSSACVECHKHAVNFKASYPSIKASSVSTGTRLALVEH